MCIFHNIILYIQYMIILYITLTCNTYYIFLIIYDMIWDSMLLDYILVYSLYHHIIYSLYHHIILNWTTFWYNIIRYLILLYVASFHVMCFHSISGYFMSFYFMWYFFICFHVILICSDIFHFDLLHCISIFLIYFIFRFIFLNLFCSIFLQIMWNHLIFCLIF